MDDNLAESAEPHHADLLCQALPVARIDDIDLNNPPTSGEDYLTRVRLEATKNAVKVANKIDLKKYEKNRTPQFESENVSNIDKNLKPSKEWQNEKCLEFSQLRDRTRKERPNFLKNNPVDKKSLNLPSSGNKKEWELFCFGKSGKSSKQANNESLKGHEPSLTILYNLDQTRVVSLFDIMVEWTDEHGYSRQAFEWMFSLMCFLEKPIVPETHSSLRDLCRNCINMRSKLVTKDDMDENLMELNLFITIIARYFQQYDLADNDD